MLTPYDGWPDMTYLESLEAELQDVMIDGTASGGRGLVKGVKRSKKRRRTRSSQGTLDFTSCRFVNDVVLRCISLI